MDKIKRVTYYMRMDGRRPEAVLHYNFLTEEKVFKRKDKDLWCPIPLNWYKEDGNPMSQEEIRILRFGK